MRYAYFPGCKIPFYLPHYGVATQALMAAVDVDLVEIEFNCCGYPVRNLSFDSYLLSAARNLALAEKQGLDIVTPCKCCFGSLKHAEHLLRENKPLRDETNRILLEEGLQYEGRTRIKHVLTVLDQDVGVEAIAARIKRQFDGLNVAAHYGCHALRPSKITQFDDAMAPTIFERLIEVSGARCVPWSKRLECCGNPLTDKNRRLALDLMHKKIGDARQSGADYICTACTYCQIQFDAVQAEDTEFTDRLPSITYPQLLGLSLGLPESSLGLDRNKLDVSGVKKFLA